MDSTTETKDALAKDVSDLKRDVTQLITDSKRHATAHVGAQKQKVQDTVNNAKEYFKGHPFTVLGIALGIGFLLGVRCRR